MSNFETDIICLIRDYPLITVDQLCRLTGRPMQSVARSLKKLCEEKRPYINRNEKKENIAKPYVYAVTKNAAQDKSIGGYPVDLSERKDKGLTHEILITDIHIALKDQVIYWRQDRKTLWRYGIQPDAFFKYKLHDGEKGKRSFFLEAETGSNNPVDVYAKYQGYEKLRGLMQAQKLDWLPMIKFSVLTVLPTAEDALDLQKELIKQNIIDKDYVAAYYIFTPLSELLIK